MYCTHSSVHTTDFYMIISMHGTVLTYPAYTESVVLELFVLEKVFSTFVIPSRWQRKYNDQEEIGTEAFICRNTKQYREI